MELTFNTTSVNNLVICYLELIPASLQLRRANDPKCTFWNVTTGQWDDRGVSTVEVNNIDTGEFKIYNVKCSASHATAFGVIVDQDTEV